MWAGAVAQDSSDNKILANVVRALGNILAMVKLPGNQPPVAAMSQQAKKSIGQVEIGQQAATTQGQINQQQAKNCQMQWFVAALCCLQACLQSTNGKVQWNACYAVGGLLQNDGAANEASQLGILTQLLQILLGLVRDHRNYKVRISLIERGCVR